MQVIMTLGKAATGWQILVNGHMEVQHQIFEPHAVGSHVCAAVFT
jgi:hypothetical protein